MRGKITIAEYENFAFNTVKPTYFVGMTEHILPHSGRKKKIKNSLQSLSNCKRILEEKKYSQSKILLPIWADIMWSKHEYVKDNYTRKLQKFVTECQEQHLP